MPGRNYSTDIYRFSINGQEKSTEISFNSTTAQFWQYDSRIVRRWNVDPLVKEFESSYLVFGGNPVLLSDPNGDVAGGGGDPTPKSPNFRLGGIPVFMREFEFKRIHAIDLEYSKTSRGKIHTLTLELPTGTLRLMILQRATTSEKQKNREANEKANPTQKGNTIDNTAGHEVPYASTTLGGKYAMRRITDAKENRDHGFALNQFYNEFGITAGKFFIVPLFESKSSAPEKIPDINPVSDPKWVPFPVNNPFGRTVPAPTSPRPIPVRTGPGTGARGGGLIFFIFSAKWITEKVCNDWFPIPPPKPVDSKIETHRINASNYLPSQG